MKSNPTNKQHNPLTVQIIQHNNHNSNQNNTIPTQQFIKFHINKILSKVASQRKRDNNIAIGLPKSSNSISIGLAEVQ